MDPIAKIDLIHKLTWPYRVVREKLISIRRVFYWLPFIWKDRWWDSSFMLRILEAKLRYDAVRYERNGVACGRERRAKQMRTAAILCHRLAEENYTSPWDAEQQEEAQHFFNYLMSNKKDEGDGLVYYTSEGYEPNPLLKKMSKWASDRKEYMRNQDLKLLLGFLKRHMFGWWD